MARYELGAIYKINGKENVYYARLWTQDTYGIFEPIYGEICQENFLDRNYENWPQSEICGLALGGTPEHQRKQIAALKKLGFDLWWWKLIDSVDRQLRIYNIV